jgi:uncharacterized protein YlaI
MKVKCMICEKIFASEGAHLQTFKDPAKYYVCLLCSVEQEIVNVTNQQG